MSTGNLALMAGAPSEPGPFYADCFAKRGSAAVRPPFGRTRTKNAVQNPFRLAVRTQPLLEDDIRVEERARIVHELHDTLLQGFVGASMLLHLAVEQTPADSPSKPALNRALHLVHQAIKEGRAAMRGLRTAPARSTLDRAFSNLVSEVTSGTGPRIRVSVQGGPQTLNPTVQEQLFLIGREAVMNALRHSEATEIDVEVQYLDDGVCVFVRDNGRGIDSDAVRKKSDSHWGLCGMRERAENIGGQLDLRSRRGRGTEVGVIVPAEFANQTTLERDPWAARRVI
jgi:signal transduction histidine kinase